MGDGVLLRDKPAGMTSHDVVAEVRRRLGRSVKVGHAGTLDPFATGLLLVLVGRATRAQRFLMALPKTYRVVARLGHVSDTGDPDGEVRATGRMPERLEIPVGTREQRPPAYSAVKVGGRRAYELAREGTTPELAPRPVTVHRAELLWERDGRAAFEIECSSGTYVRSLVADLGDAYCEQLERTAIGPFRLADADPERLVALGEALCFLPERRLTPDEARAVRHGRAVESNRGLTPPPPPPPTPGLTPPDPRDTWPAAIRLTPPDPRDTWPAAVRLMPSDPRDTWPAAVRLTHAGELIAIGEPRAAELKPVVVFSPA